MKIKVVEKKYSEVCKIAKPKHKKPRRSWPVLRLLMKELGKKDLKEVNFEYKFEGIEKFPEEPCLILMNHSSFIDLEIASNILYPKPFSIVCTSDGFVGKEGLMRNLGCIPTNKFVSDPVLISDISYALKKKRTHVLMYPEASYSFDGTATPLPRKLGVVLKLLKVPVIMIKTDGAFLRDPLYNMLQKRNVNVSATVSMLCTKEDLKSLTISEVDALLDNAFNFDNFKVQSERGIKVSEPFRADGLERILFKCPVCEKEGTLKGKGTLLRCSCCGNELELDEYGKLVPKGSSKCEFGHIPDWYSWERQNVRNELENGSYKLEFDCRIIVFRDFKAVYDIGHGHLTHTCEGFSLVNDDGSLCYNQGTGSSYSLYADYFWYELGDVICIGNNDMLYYCLPLSRGVPVAKARIATEELYKISRLRKNRETV